MDTNNNLEGKSPDIRQRISLSRLRDFVPRKRFSTKEINQTEDRLRTILERYINELGRLTKLRHAMADVTAAGGPFTSNAIAGIEANAHAVARGIMQALAEELEQLNKFIEEGRDGSSAGGDSNCGDSSGGASPEIEEEREESIGKGWRGQKGAAKPDSTRRRKRRNTSR